MKLRTIQEATTEWLGPIQVLLGTGAPNTLNWGTGSPDRPPFLYIPIGLEHIRAVTRHLEPATAWYDTIKRVGGIGGSEVDFPHYFEVVPKVGRRMKHLGEAHITVAMGEDCARLGSDQDATRRLRQLGLFDVHGGGITIPISHTGNFRVLRASYYRDQADPEGPLLIAEQVTIPLLDSIRQRIGAGPLPRYHTPGVPYVLHITIGFITARDLVAKSYVDRYGKQPRTRTD